MAFQPYLNFRDNAREAFTRYHEIFGGNLVLLTGNDVPPGADAPPAEFRDLIIHAALEVGDDFLMASDTGAENFGPVQWMYVSYTTDEVADANRVFDALAEGGDVEVPFGQTFFSPGFGVTKDRFGVPWMISTNQPQG
ncbi:MAG TPA: VOC family protein [Acidimicrobiales bacterium]|jgi:PhnB protein|nr:VOC family protein [Acidimicrobiales bacterium]